MLVGTGADVIVVELGFTALQHFSGHMGAVTYPNLTVSGQAFLRQFTSTIVLILTGKIICRHLNSTVFYPEMIYFSRKILLVIKSMQTQFKFTQG